VSVDSHPRTSASTAGHRLAAAVSVVVVVLLLGLLLWPDGLALNRAVVRLYVFFLERGMPAAVTPDVYAVLLNVLVFALLAGIGVLVLRRRPLPVTGVLVAFSVAVELFQALPGVARDPSLLDVACNALGAALGAGLASVLRPHAGRGDGGSGDQAGVDQPGHEGRDVGGERLGG